MNPTQSGDDKLVYENEFINSTILRTVNVSQLNREQAKQRALKFRKYHESKVGNAVVRPTIKKTLIKPAASKSRGDSLLTNNIHAPQTAWEKQMTGKPVERNVFTRSTPVNIDSRDRDQSIYPKPNSYTISLGKRFTNVKEVSIRSSEFPNSEQLILESPPSKANNKIYWKDDGNNNVYVASIPAGNYRPSTLQTDIQAAMNAVKRSDTGANHEFTVSIDTVSSICSFSSLITKQLSNPFSAVAGTNIITVLATNHGLATGNLVNISGTSAFGGINVSLINQNQVIEVIDTDNFSFEIADTIIQDSTAAGGNSVRIGIGQKFSLLWSQPGTPAQLLGFIPEDTIFSSVQTNTMTNQTIAISRVRGIDTIFTAITMDTLPEIDIQIGDRVYIINVDGTSADDLINEPAGYIISPMTTLDLTTIGATSDEAARTFKIPATITTGISILNTGSVTTRSINRPVKLAGENYFFMTCPLLSSLSNSGIVKNIFAKIDLSAPPGNILYNTHISAPKVFETAQQYLEELSFTYVNQANELIDFLDSDHSFTLMVKEEVYDIGEGNSLNTKTGMR